MRRILRIGSRESRLAVAQSRLVMDAIQKANPGLEICLITMKSSGDMLPQESIDSIDVKALFTKELEQALLDDQIDIAIHSLKDMSMKTDERIPILAVSGREDPRDVLVYPLDVATPDLSVGGCSSARRRVQLGRLMPLTRVNALRGNVLTRLNKLDEGQYGFIVLAAAGLHRLGLQHRISRYLSTEEMIPAAGQGILAIQGRAGEDIGYLASVHDPESMICAQAERACVQMLDGGCSLPIAAFAQLEHQQFRLSVLYADEQKGIFIKKSGIADACEHIQLSEKLAREIRNEAGL